MQTSIEQFNDWLSTESESTSLEFKEAANQFSYDRTLSYCVALANEGGGKLILGVSDGRPRQVKGTLAFENPQEVQTRIFDKLRFRVDIEEFFISDKRVLIFHIPGRSRCTAYNLDGKYLMRSGDQLVPMSEDRLRAIFAEGKPDWLLESAKSDLSAQDVVSLLDTQSYFDLIKLPYPTTRESVLDKFQREKFIASERSSWLITNLGAILFAKRLEEFETVKRKAPRLIAYTGTDKLSTRLDRFGTKGYAVAFEGLIDFIDAQVPANEVIGVALRREVKMFPREAVRELVANALVHQDFNESGTSVAIELYSDRMEVSSPGVPFIPTERFIDEYQSRNERLADIMRRLGICEEKGSGIDRVIRTAEILQLPAPDFRKSDRKTIIVLFAHVEFDKMNGDARIRACYQHCCLKYVMNERMTNQSLRSRFGLVDAKTETVSRILGDAVEANLIKLEDAENASKRYAKYIPFWA